MSVANNFRDKYQLGTLGATSKNMGDFEVTGTLQLYFADHTEYNRFLNQTATSLSIALSDGSGWYAAAPTLGNGYIFDLPNVRYTDATRVAGGRNQDIICDVSFQGIYNSTDTASLRVAKIA